METKPKKRGDRRDGYLVRDGDPLHVFMPYLMGERAENEAVLTDNFDFSAATDYLNKKNETAQHHYTYFHLIIAALAKTIYLRPKMNRYIAGHRYYDRDNISFSFVAKNKMSDNGEESLLIIKAEDDGTNLIDQIHDKICAEVYKVREQKQVDGTTNTINWLTKIPRPILKIVIKLLFWLVYHDILPKQIYDFDPYRSTVFISNLGSIKMSASYHHLVNWSLNSIFVIANQKKKIPFFNDDGSYEMKDSIGIGFTIDERIADGFYFAKSIDLFKYIVTHPELLDSPLSQPIEIKEND